MGIRRSIFKMMFVLVMIVALVFGGAKGLTGALAHQGGGESEAEEIAEGEQPAGGGTFIVDTASDDADDHIGDCQCHTAAGKCSLRAAVQEANACSGKQTINFASPMTIQLTSRLPALTADYTELDAFSQRVTENGVKRPGVVLDGGGSIDYGIVVKSSYNTVVALTVVGFKYDGILLEDDNPSDTQYTSNNYVAYNVVSRNGWYGIVLSGAGTTENAILENWVGTNPLGTDDTYDGISDWGNGRDGILIVNGESNYVNSNLVGNNGWGGINLVNADNVEMEDNGIGIGNGYVAIGNQDYGIYVGGGAKGVKINHNEIANNKRGVYVANGASVTIENNRIHTNVITTGNGGGIYVTGSASLTAHDNEIYYNTAVSGGGIAIDNNATANVYSNTIRENTAYNSTSDGTTGGGGIYAYDSPLVWWGIIVANKVNENTITGNNSGGGGGGIAAINGDTLSIGSNSIENNKIYLVDDYHGSGIHLSYQPTAVPVSISENWLSGNSGGKGTIYVANSKKVALENNIISKNGDYAGLYLLSSQQPLTETNNTIVGNAHSGIGVKDTHFNLVNNIIASNGDYGIRFDDAGWVLDLNKNNDVWNNGSGGTNETLYFFLNTDPKFFDEANEKYMLMVDSPCLDAGSATYGSTTSYNSLSRPQGAGVDIGAYEMFPPVHLPIVLRGFH